MASSIWLTGGSSTLTQYSILKLRNCASSQLDGFHSLQLSVQQMLRIEFYLLIDHLHCKTRLGCKVKHVLLVKVGSIAQLEAKFSIALVLDCTSSRLH